jgi:acetolactate synthase-1/2/3 large subunit
MTTSATKLSDYVFRFLADRGVEHVFMLPGGGAMHLNDSLGRCRGLGYVVNLHEQAAAIAAEAYARVTNNLGVALVTCGPGGTNALTGVAAAWLDSTPCLFLSGQVKRADLTGSRGLRQLGVQEIDIVSMVRPITKYAVTIMEPDSIRYHLEKAVWLAKSGRPGPVWIDIPLDVQAASIDPAALPGFVLPIPPVEGLIAAGVTRVIELLNASQRPILLAGNGIRLAGAQQEFLALVERLEIPVLTTRLGVDLIPDAHPRLVGMPGGIAPRGANFALQNADWLLILGARLDMALIAYAPEKLARAARKIMVNIDPAEIAKLGPAIDVPLACDVGRFLRELAGQAGRIVPRDRTAWQQRCRRWKADYPFVLPEHRAETRGISVYAFSEILCDELAGDDVVLPGNSGLACEIFLTAFKVKAGQRVFHNKGTGAMGFCQPAAIGACLASGRRRTIAVDGDGGFQLNVQELETVKRLGLPVKFFVVNNQGYASIRASQQGHFGRLTAADTTSGLTLPDVVRQAEAYGLPSVRLSDPADLRRQLRAVLETPGPVVCEVVVLADEPRQPRVASVQRPDGSMVSKPLEEMWPPLPREEFLANMIVPPLEE